VQRCQHRSHFVPFLPCMQARRALAAVQRANASAAQLQYEIAHVTKMQALSMGDRACVDLCSKMLPGEGMLVGNFCRALFLVHSEVRHHACFDKTHLNGALRHWVGAMPRARCSRHTCTAPCSCTLLHCGGRATNSLLVRASDVAGCQAPRVTA
jgi:3-dehydroquinate synthase II